MRHLLLGLLAEFDGFERSIAELVVAELKPAGIPICGLPAEFSDLAARNRTAAHKPRRCT